VLNRLPALYDVTKKVRLAEYFPEDADGGELAPEGRVMEMLSEHTFEGWLEGYRLSGRHGLINGYEPFIHVIDSNIRGLADHRVRSEQFHARNWPNNAMTLSGIEWLRLLKRA
jgi:phosphoketolase